MLKKISIITLSLFIVALLSVSWVIFEVVANKIEIAVETAIALNKIKHQKDIMRIKVKHKKEIARLKINSKKQLAKVKMQERSKRWLASIPVIGTLSLFWSGKDEYDEYKYWLEDNPGRGYEGYALYKTELLVGPNL